SLLSLLAYDCPLANFGGRTIPRGVVSSFPQTIWRKGTVMQLESLGADARLLDAFQKHAAQGLTLARVVLSQRDQYRLLTESEELDAEPSGALWYRTPNRAGMPVVGDWVAAREVGPGQAIVDAVLPR